MQLAMGRLIDRYSLPSLFVALSVLQPLGLGIAAVSTGLPLLAGLVLAMTAIYGQVVINDAMIARYVPPAYRARAYSVRYFVGFTASGFVVPAIALLHDRGGFALVLGVASACGAVIWLSALGFLRLTQGGERPALAAAE